MFSKKQIKYVQFWKLTRREDIPLKEDPWNPPTNKSVSLIILAHNENEARQLAQKESIGDEVIYSETCWLDPSYSTCEVMLPEGEPKIIIQDTY